MIWQEADLSFNNGEYFACLFPHDRGAVNRLRERIHLLNDAWIYGHIRAGDPILHRRKGADITTDISRKNPDGIPTSCHKHTFGACLCETVLFLH